MSQPHAVLNDMVLSLDSALLAYEQCAVSDKLASLGQCATSVNSLHAASMGIC